MTIEKWSIDSFSYKFSYLICSSIKAKAGSILVLVPIFRLKCKQMYTNVHKCTQMYTNVNKCK